MKRTRLIRSPRRVGMSSRQKTLAAVHRALLASATPLAPSSASPLAPRAFGELAARWANLAPSHHHRVVSRGASGGRAGVAGASPKGPFAVPTPSRAEHLPAPARQLAALGDHRAGLATAQHARDGGAGAANSRLFSSLNALKWTAAALAALEVALWASSQAYAPDAEEQTVSNWSGTQHVDCARYAQPESIEALEKAVEWAHTYRRRIRPVGSALSPNGAAFNPEGMLSLAMLDDVVRVDPSAMTVTVRAGARVLELVEKLRPHGLTLANYASIREQQIGGFTQVGAHGTGATIPPLDETVCDLTLVTPGKGTIRLSDDDADPDTFRMARCGVGSLGVVSEVTLRCVPSHRLLERTWTATHDEIHKNHARWLEEHKHIRYMWIPHTKTVVVVGSNPLAPDAAVPKPTSAYSEAKKVEPMVRLLREVAPDVDSGGMGFGQLRDELLKVNPLDLAHVKRCNAAEAEFWRRNSGTRCDWSDQILGFDCGGEQHVYEIAFRTGDDVEGNTGADLAYMKDLLAMIDREGIPAPAPIEQRWSAGSNSPLSPATNDGHDLTKPGLHSWIGIIMYLPSPDPASRDAITRAFKSYAKMEEDALGDTYGIRTHWAKIELPDGEEERKEARARIERRYPSAEKFRKIRAELDPKGVLGNNLIEGLLGDPKRVLREGQSRSDWNAPGEYFGAAVRAAKRAMGQGA